VKASTVKLCSKSGIYRLKTRLRRRYEVARIKAAARAVGGNSYRPTITFVVCGKRHRMRFYATKDLDRDRIGNLPAGLVVDSGVTDPFLFEFYREFLLIHHGACSSIQCNPTQVFRERPGLPISEYRSQSLLCTSSLSSVVVADENGVRHNDRPSFYTDVLVQGG
jgi:hypothetical protein